MFHLDAALPQLAALTAWCGAPPRAVPALLLLTGLVGGLAHCGPMCGPFVLAQAANVPFDLPVVRRLAGGLLLPYHFGRVATYTVLGAAAGGFGHAIISGSSVRLAVVILLQGAALLFLAQAVARIAPADPSGWAARPVLGWANGLAALSQPLLQASSPASRLALGAVLGFLPCGFLYAALAAAATTQSAVAGAVAMAAFGLGTVPSLLLVGIGGAAAAMRWRAVARRLMAPLFLFNAAALSAMAVAVAAGP